MTDALPPLRTTTIGSYAHPAWLYASQSWMAEGRFGPTDVREAYDDDAVDRAIADQELAGLDEITDGEMRRESFVWVKRLGAAGCPFIQLDEPATPGYGYDPHAPTDIARLFNACVEGVEGVKFGLHICFGTFRKITYAKRTYAPYFPDLLEARADQFAFEFANREMYEIEKWADWAPDRELCAGIIDVRTHYLETADDVAERARTCLQHIPAERLCFSPDCGLRYVPRWLARGKLHALADGVARVRAELTGSTSPA